MKCEICGKDALSRFCNLHQSAYENVKKNFAAWKKALDITWEDYLREIAKNPNTGKWAVEVAEYLLKKGEKLRWQEK